jgi:hypothetical protein
MHLQRPALLVLLVLFTLSFAWGRRRDPLNQLEIDQLREAAQEPEARLKLLVQFARARLASLDQVRSDSKTAGDRPRQVHDLLDDFVIIYDELSDNIQTYLERQADLRKPLKVIIEADGEFQAKLAALKDAAPPEEIREYEFVLTSALEAVASGLEDHQKLLAEQIAAAKEKKKKK